MRAMTIQSHRLVEELHRAAVPKRDQTGVLAMFYSVLDFFLPRMGIPHGVAELTVTARGVYIRPGDCAVAYCASRDYRAVDPVPKSDGLPYPSCATAQTELNCVVPRAGRYSVIMKVTVNGAITAKIVSATPEAACV